MWRSLFYWFWSDFVVGERGWWALAIEEATCLGLGWDWDWEGVD
ncbi:MAG: hypothetical protein N2Z75_03460 [Meiothermus sp.]|nr:hypothetical protein [Meiothermus sp.]MCS7057942.1 hypothetical protein [Meiothermus sp.]MCS7193668.1 hypothetical protein [Meiothermus sp.]MCX7600984.1 hypothetical protein [Meiothermus sp.]MDW8091306.1 hypothetical protein [Meiothermus sp.]MDW8481567.1 hypothetical protein [Meiothermus sp.]